jgi:hypothetical protein
MKNKKVKQKPSKTEVLSVFKALQSLNDLRKIYIVETFKKEHQEFLDSINKNGKKNKKGKNKHTMTHIEQLHLDAMIVKDLQAAAKSAEITEQIAIEFIIWIYKNEECVSSKTNKELFQEYLKTKENV